MEKISFQYKNSCFFPAPKKCPFPSRKTFIDFMDCFSIIPIENRYDAEEEAFMKKKKEWKETDSYPSVWKFTKDFERIQFTLHIDVEEEMCQATVFFSINDGDMVTVECMNTMIRGLQYALFIVKQCYDDKTMFLNFSEEELMDYWDKTERQYNKKQNSEEKNSEEKNSSTTTTNSTEMETEEEELQEEEKEQPSLGLPRAKGGLWYTGVAAKKRQLEREEKRMKSSEMNTGEGGY